MARPEVKRRPVNMSDPERKRALGRWFNLLEGMYEVTAVPKRDTPTNTLRAYYHAEICPALADYFNAQEIRLTTPDEADKIIKAHILSEPVYHPETGVLLATFVPSTAGWEFGPLLDFVQRARAWLVEEFHLPTYDPERDPEIRRENRKRRREELVNQ